MKNMKGLCKKIKEKEIKIIREDELKDKSKEAIELKFMLQNSIRI
ncbi:hypothetical protein [Clostridium cochlearium]|nr:hypothetical protein [Clostridium cochlearium]